MLITNDIVHRVFKNASEAEAMAKELNAEDDWDYRVSVDPKGSGKAIIHIYDEDNYLIGKL